MSFFEVLGAEDPIKIGPQNPTAKSPLAFAVQPADVLKQS